MTARRLSLSSLSAILCSSVGLWISCGTLAVTGPEAGMQRIGVLPPLWWLGSLVLTGLGVALLLRPAGREVALLWLSALTILPWLPWLPGPLSTALFVLTGNLRGWIWVAIFAGLLIPPIASALSRGWFASVTDPRRAPWIAGCISAIVYLAAAWAISPQLPGGDEPHYLIIAQSLLRDGDLQIENNQTRGDYHEFFAPPLKPDYLRRGKNGQIYSIHAPGLPAIVAPALAVFGYPGVRAFLAIVSAGATALVWIAVWRVSGSAAGSWFGWAGVAMSAPFLFQAFTVYPDGMGAAIVIAGVLAALTARNLSPRGLVAAGAALSLLPWLHTRFALIAGALGVVMLIRLWPATDRIRRIVAFAAIPTAGAIAWFGFFYSIYGTPNPAAPYGGYTQSAIGNVPRGLMGLLLDQQFGIVPNAPVYLCALAGVPLVARRFPRLAIELTLIVVPYALATAAYFMWWGGFSSPGRFLVSILLPAAIPAGLWFGSQRLAGRLIGAAALLLSLTISASLVLVDRGALVYNVRDGASKLLLWLVPLVDITTALPSLFQTGLVVALLRALLWFAAIAATAVSVTLTVRHVRAGPSAALALGLAAAFASTLATVAAWHIDGKDPLTSERAGPGLLRALDPGSGQVAVRYGPLHRIRLEELLSSVPIATKHAGRAMDPLVSISHPAAGTYRITATIAGQPQSIAASVDRAAPLWRWTIPPGFRGEWHETITIPVATWSLRIDGEGWSQSEIASMDIRAERVPAAKTRITDREAGHAARYGPAMVFLLGGSAFMEQMGAWVAGRQSADFAMASDASSLLHLFVRNFAVDNTVTIDADGIRQQLTLKPREERIIDLPLDPARHGIVVRVTSESGGKPSDFEAGSQDQRMLGCWIEPR